MKNRISIIAAFAAVVGIGARRGLGFGRTVALAAAGKWTYVVGDLTCDSHLEDIVIAARRYAASPEGIVPWRERPLSFRKGVVSRTPPLAFAGIAPA